jgi:Protein of unknown function (DUF1573)
MSDDFGTVNVRPGARAREIEVMRQNYRLHREALVRMAAEAPTEQLAAEYQRLIASIDNSIRKLDELEGRPVTSPGNRPLVVPAEDDGVLEPPASAPAAASSRVVLILVAGLAVLGAIGWLIWRASSDRRAAAPPPTATEVAEQPATTPAEPATMVPVQPVPVSAAASLRVTPAVQDYGIIRKGTRAVREFELTNTGSTPITIEVARSACRCLYYDFSNKPIQPQAHETITVTVDAARAKTPAINEQLTITAKEDPTATAAIGVRAEIR